MDVSDLVIGMIINRQQAEEWVGGELIKKKPARGAGQCLSTTKYIHAGCVPPHKQQPPHDC